MATKKSYSYKEAEGLLQEGKKIKLPEWKGFWFKDKDSDKVLVLTKDNEILDTPHDQYKSNDNWEVAKATTAQNKLIKSYYENLSAAPVIEALENPNQLEEVSNIQATPDVEVKPSKRKKVWVRDRD